MGQSDESEAGRASVRPLRPADVEALADLWVASWQEAMPAIDFFARRAWIVGFLGAPECTTLVVERAGTAAGFATFEGGYLHQLVVAPGAKGGGLARRLLDAAKAKTPAGLALDVNQANARAVRFYRREGFAVVGEGINPASGLATFALRWARPSP